MKSPKTDQFLGDYSRFIVHFPLRKGVERPYFTSVERDGIQALQRYLEKWRGRIRDGDPVFLNERGNPLTSDNIVDSWTRYLEKAGIITKWSPKCSEWILASF